MAMKKSELINLMIDAVRPAIRQQIKEFFLPAVQKIIQNEFKKFKASQSIISDSSKTTTPTKRQLQNREQLRSNFAEKLGLNNFDPRQLANQYSLGQNRQPSRQKPDDVDQYLSSILGSVNMNPSAYPSSREQIVQDTDFDPMSFDAPSEIINESKYRDQYQYEDDDLDDVDGTIGYKNSVVENPQFLKKLGLKIKH